MGSAGNIQPPPDTWIANEPRRDTSQLRQNEMFGVLLDTFHDRRNGYNFYTNLDSTTWWRRMGWDSSAGCLGAWRCRPASCMAAA